MPNPTYLGYLTNPYLQDPYSGDTGLYSWGMQVERFVVDKPNPVGAQVTVTIVDHLKNVAMSTTLTINDEYYLGMEVSRESGVQLPIGSQVDSQITGISKIVGAQSTITISDSLPFGMQVHRYIKDEPNAVGMSVELNIVDQTKGTAMEVRMDHSMASWLCEDFGYLNEAYMETAYLTEGICAQMGYQAQRKLNKVTTLGMEVQRIIESDKSFGAQTELTIADFPFPTAMSVDRLHAVSIGMQTRLVLYNTTNLRIMCDFPSRGVSGVNWVATDTASGDFDPNNLNTDIVEQVWRSNGSTSNVLECDTEVPQGVAIDTFAILNHNLTTSATITVEGSDSPTFASIEQSFAMEVETINSYYIAPTFPTLQSRYWRILINDATNPNGYLQIGTIVFGTSIIFQGECFTDNVRRKLIHFADKVMTEGFTNVSNDRALKTSVGLEFRFLRFQRGNYKNIRGIFEYARTSLKCLWIPDPREPKRFGVFGKLTDIPSELHRNLGSDASDTVDFDIEVDESL